MLTTSLVMLSFVAPWMALGAIAALGLPLLAHLLSRTRYREARFPAVRFVRQAIAATSRIESPRHRLLMLLRWLTLLLLVVAFMRPQWLPEAEARDPSNGVTLVVLIDASASMQRVDRGVSLFDRAKREAQSLVDGLDASRDRAAVVVVNRQPRSLLPEATARFDLLKQPLHAAQPGHTTANWAGAMAIAQRLADRAERPATIVTLSDQQGSTPNLDATGPRATASVRHLRFDGPTDNSALRIADVRPYPAIRGRPVTVVIEAEHYGETPRQTRLVAQLGGTSLSQTVTLGPNTQQRVELRFPSIERSSTLRVSLESSDAMRQDDIAGAWLPVADRTRVVVVHDDHASSSAIAERLATMLNPAAGESRESSASPAYPEVFAIARGDAVAELRRSDAKSLRTVVLVDPTPLGDELSQALEAFAQSGGGVLRFVGDPARRANRTDAAVPDFSLEPLRVFEGASRRGLIDLRWPGVDGSPIDAAAEALLVDRDGRAIVATLERGRGRVIAINAALKGGPGGLLAEPSFVVLFNELCRYASPGPAMPPAAHPGDAMPKSLRDALRLSTPDSSLNGDDALTTPGLYAALDANGSVTDAVWVALDPSESNTRPTPDWNRSDEPTRDASAGGTDSVSIADSLRATPVELWPHCALGVLLLLAAESSLLALFAGGRRSVEQAGGVA
ncbi:MAG: BatA domain-containing protein [Phycisphaeraceae bacterium]